MVSITTSDGIGPISLGELLEEEDKEGGENSNAILLDDKISVYSIRDNFLIIS